ncbi:hypothetical protein EMIT0196MI5_60164 [Pseudomonas sp. IT-196MI5]
MAFREQARSHMDRIEPVGASLLAKGPELAVEGIS